MTLTVSRILAPRNWSPEILTWAAAAGPRRPRVKMVQAISGGIVTVAAGAVFAALSLLRFASIACAEKSCQWCGAPGLRTRVQ